MNMVMIICPEARQEEVRTLIDRHKVHAYTELPQVLGAGATGRHMGTHTWPGASTLIFTVVEKNKTAELMAALKEFQSKLYSSEGLKAFVMPVESSI